MDPILKERIERLVERAQNDDRSAFEELIECTQDRLFKFCLYLTNNRELAQDICQESYIKSLHNIKNLKKGASFLSWLFITTKNIFIDYKRKKKNLAHQQIIEELVPDESNVSKELELQNQIHTALQSVSENDGFALLLIYLEGRSYKEVADIMGVSENALKSRIHRAKATFVKSLENNETSTPANASIHERSKV